ncbi:uncharacterized protein WCC33_006520 [Rhinophrynus dorsalis]
MELALPLSCYLLWFSSFVGVSGSSFLLSSLVTFQNESLIESGRTCHGIVLFSTNETHHSLVCDDNWSVDSPLAHVVCKESGCGTPNNTWTLQSSPPNIEAVQGAQCSGKESTVSGCESLGQSVKFCAPERIAAVSCNQNVTSRPDNRSLRLSRGRASCDGHLEVFRERGWRSVCYDEDMEDSAEVLCQQMGCAPQHPLFTPLYKGKRSSGAVQFHCVENETYFWECDQLEAKVCVYDLVTYLQCDRSRMPESWMVWIPIVFAILIILFFCWDIFKKTWNSCFKFLMTHLSACFSCISHTGDRWSRKTQGRRSIYRRETPSFTVQEANSPPSSPGVLQNPTEVNALLAPHGFRLNNTITPPPSYMHALKVLSRPLENTRTPPPSYLEALKILSRPVIVHVHADDSPDEKEELSAHSSEENGEESQHQ